MRENWFEKLFLNEAKPALNRHSGGGGEGVTPTGTIDIIENGEHDVTNYATANVSVPDDFFEKYMARSFTEFESDTAYPIRYGMFRNCKELISVDCPNVPLVEHEAFRFDSRLQEVNLPSVTQLDPYAFASCTKLETLNLPSIKILKGNTLNQCTSLKSFPYFDRLEEIGGYEFRQCPIEPKVWDFNNLTTIAAQYAFSEASAEVIICRKALNAGMDRAFHGAPSLRVVDLHEAFQIGRYAFQNCPNMEALILRDTENIFSLKNVDVLESNTNFYTYVHASMLERYKAASNWSAHPDRLRVIEDYPDITGGVY